MLLIFFSKTFFVKKTLIDLWKSSAITMGAWENVLHDTISSEQTLFAWLKFPIVSCHRRNINWRAAKWVTIYKINKQNFQRNELCLQKFYSKERESTKYFQDSRLTSTRGTDAAAIRNTMINYLKTEQRTNKIKNKNRHKNSYHYWPTIS